MSTPKTGDVINAARRKAEGNAALLGYLRSMEQRRTPEMTVLIDEQDKLRSERSGSAARAYEDKLASYAQRPELRIITWLRSLTRKLRLSLPRRRRK